MHRLLLPAALAAALLASACAANFQRAPGPGFSQARLERLQAGMQGYIERGETPGVVTLVYRRGETADLRMLGVRDLQTGAPMTRDTIFRIYSMTKPITSVAALILVEEGRLRLNEPVAKWLPELEKVMVLKRPAGPLAEVEALETPITLRHLLTHTSGLAYDFTAEGPLRAALREKELTGASHKDMTPDEFMRRLGALPLHHQPGTRWHYSLATDVLGILVERAGGMPFAGFLQTRIFEPLGMKDTAFQVPEEKRGRFSVNYYVDPESGELKVLDHPERSVFSEPPAYASGGGGLVSTIDDYLRFSRMLLDGGTLEGVRILSRKTVQLMTSSALTPEERDPGNVDARTRRAFAGQTFGLGVRVVEDIGLASGIGSPGAHGWGGAAGTLYFIDPQEELVAIFMTQVMGLGENTPIRQDFETLVYQAIDD